MDILCWHSVPSTASNFVQFLASFLIMSFSLYNVVTSLRTNVKPHIPCAVCVHTLDCKILLAANPTNSRTAAHSQRIQIKVHFQGLFVDLIIDGQEIVAISKHQAQVLLLWLPLCTLYKPLPTVI